LRCFDIFLNDTYLHLSFIFVLYKKRFEGAKLITLLRLENCLTKETNRVDGKKNFAEVSKNFAGYRYENNSQYQKDRNHSSRTAHFGELKGIADSNQFAAMKLRKLTNLRP